MANDLHKQIVRLIKLSGGEFVREGKGSHEIWKGTNGRKISVPKPCKRRHTANNILKELGIDERV